MDDEDFELNCAACGWTGDQLSDHVEQEQDGSGLTWWCPNCDAQWSED